MLSPVSAPCSPARLESSSRTPSTQWLLWRVWLVTPYCANGHPVATDWMPGVGHDEATIEAAPPYIQWLCGMIPGQQPTSDCGKPLPVTPAQPTT